MRRHSTSAGLRQDHNLLGKLTKTKIHFCKRCSVTLLSLLQLLGWVCVLVQWKKQGFMDETLWTPPPPLGRACTMLTLFAKICFLPQEHQEAVQRTISWIQGQGLLKAL